MRSNCVVFALALYRRRRKKGREGYIAIRRSRWGKFPHLLYCERRHTGTWRMVSYKPKRPAKHLCPPLFFDGRPEHDD